MRFDSGDDADVIRLRRVPVNDYGKTFRSRSHADHGHRSADGRAHECFRDPVAFQDFALSLGRASAMTAHCRNQKRLGSKVLEEASDRLQDQWNIGDSSAAGGQSDTLARLDSLGKVELFQLGAYGPRHVLDLGSIKLLPHSQHLGIGHENFLSPPRSIAD